MNIQDQPDPIETTFEVNDTLYLRANIPPTDEVYIWLGVRIAALYSQRDGPDTVTGERHVGISN